ncbi:MAG: DUF883 domain-containing protein [Burkholderiales bacterium]|nr:DUF883 domain-containing protein [Opitutaceae bacterium]
MSSKSSARSAASSADSTLDDLKALLAEAETALSSVGDHASEEVTSLRGRLREALAEGKLTARHALEYAKEKGAVADEAIHTHPYIAIGIAAGVGLLAGALIARGCGGSSSR